MSRNVADLVPHRAGMCLLECVEKWSEDEIVCRATSHRRMGHPLRDEEGLRGLCAIEYGAQAIAAHAGLRKGADAEPSAGWLVAAREVAVFVARLDHIDAPLTIRAIVVSSQEAGAIYDVSVTAGEQPVLKGKLSVMMARHDRMNIVHSVDGQ